MAKKWGIEYYVREHEIVLFWEKPKGKDGLRYQIFLNEKKVADTTHTHTVIQNLEADTVYGIMVEVCDNSGKPCEMFVAQAIRTAIKKECLDVTKPPYNAVGDGKTMDTVALQRAIDDCDRNQRVYLPKGIYLTGSLRLHSHMELYLEEGAVLRGTENPEDYLPKIKSRFEGIEMECYSSLLNLGEMDHKAGYTCENVVIAGGGTIESGGKVLAQNVMVLERKRLKEYIASLGDEIKTYENEDTIPGRARPRLINISNAKNVRISGLTLKNGASWNVHMIYSAHVLTDHCSFYSENVWNGDGWDPDSSTHCTIFACEFHTGDDSIAIKSGKNPEGNSINKPTKHIRIFDCKSFMGHGITIGSEMSGGIEDVAIWDCDMKHSMNGIEIKGTKKRGGYVRHVRVRDCEVPRVLIHSVSYNDDGIAAKKPPIFEDCKFTRLHITGNYLEKDGVMKPCKGLELYGFDLPGHELKNIRFCDCRIDGEISMRYCKQVTFKGI